jgi:hypothetical protein
MVAASVVPEAFVAEAKLAVDPVAEIAPGVTVTVGWSASPVPSTATLSVSALPASAPVNEAVYVPGVEVSVTEPNEPVLEPPLSVSVKSLLGRPVIGLPPAS